MADKRAHEVRIGTSGWNYPLTGYGPWTGVFYLLKHGQKIPGAKEKFDELAYYAERFDTVEINNTPLPPATASRSGQCSLAEDWARLPENRTSPF